MHFLLFLWKPPPPASAWGAPGGAAGPARSPGSVPPGFGGPVRGNAGAGAPVRVASGDNAPQQQRQGKMPFFVSHDFMRLLLMFQHRRLRLRLVLVATVELKHPAEQFGTGDH